MITPKNIIKPITPYEAAEQFVNTVNLPDVFTAHHTAHIILLVIRHGVPMEAEGLVIDYDENVLTLNYKNGEIKMDFPILADFANFPISLTINDSIEFATDSLNQLFKPESSFREGAFHSFKYFASHLAYNHGMQLGMGHTYRVMLLDYFAIVYTNQQFPITERVFYLTRKEAIEIIDTAITLPYLNF